MTCDCKKDIEVKLLDLFKKQAPQATGHSVELQGHALSVVGNTMVLRGFIPYQMSATYMTKAGKPKLKKEIGNMIFNYCPFCGKKVNE